MANEVFRLCSNLQNGTVWIILPFSRALSYVLNMTYSVHALCSLIPKPKSACLLSLPGHLDQCLHFCPSAWYLGLGLPACSHCPVQLDQSLHLCSTAWYLGLGQSVYPYCKVIRTKIYPGCSHYLKFRGKFLNIFTVRYYFGCKADLSPGFLTFCA